LDSYFQSKENVYKLALENNFFGLYHLADNKGSLDILEGALLA
jgi:hypothetical protein